jgi:tetratricopeptide (TPR) repeat protein
MFRSQTKKSRLLSNKDVTYLIDRADDKFKHGQFGDAVHHYNAVLKRAPNNFRALHNKGLALFALSKFEKSIECYDRALGIQPNASRVKLNKAISLNSSRKFQEAKSLLDELVRLAPKNKEALNARALSEFNLGLDTEGIQDLKKAIEIDPTYTMAWNNLGCFYLGLGELDLAVDCFDQTLAVDKRNYDAFLLKDMAVERRERRLKRP